MGHQSKMSITYLLLRRGTCPFLQLLACKVVVEVGILADVPLARAIEELLLVQKCGLSANHLPLVNHKVVKLGSAGGFEVGSYVSAHVSKRVVVLVRGAEATRRGLGPRNVWLDTSGSKYRLVYGLILGLWIWRY